MNPAKKVYFHRVAAFTLIEMIGVMAIMAILGAAVIVPNGLRVMDRAAVSAEQQTLANLGKQSVKFLGDIGSPPAVATWATDIATYSDLQPARYHNQQASNGSTLLPR